jgi:hypothetical protein
MQKIRFFGRKRTQQNQIQSFFKETFAIGK